MKRIQGFSAVEVVIVVVVLVILGALGYVAYNNFVANNDTSTKETTSSSEQEPVKIESKDDLDQALNTVDSTSVDDEDAAAAQDQADL